MDDGRDDDGDDDGDEDEEVEHVDEVEEDDGAGAEEAAGGADAEDEPAPPSPSPPVSHGPPAGAIVWAKVPCFPFWPATVTAPTLESPPPPPSEAPHTYVTFFGTRDVAWVDTEAGVVRFEERPEWKEAKLSKKSLRPKYARAVQEAAERIEEQGGGRAASEEVQQQQAGSGGSVLDAE